MTTLRVLGAAALGAVAARAAYGLLRSRVPEKGPTGELGAWTRTNHRGEPVTLLEGPAFAAGATAAAAAAPGVPVRLRAAALLAGAGGGALGCYDDLKGSGDSRGFKGHLGALARGEITTGAVKILGIGATGLAAAAIVSDGPADTVINGALIASSANLANLFDLRPGRAIKAGAIAGAPLLTRGRSGAAGVTAGALGAAGALLPEDLGERAMLGDGGANAMGALLGLAAAAGLGRGGRLAGLAVVTGLTVASEFVSFTRVIKETPALNWMDMLGRRPVEEPGKARAPEPAAAPGG